MFRPLHQALHTYVSTVEWHFWVVFLVAAINRATQIGKSSCLISKLLPIFIIVIILFTFATISAFYIFILALLYYPTTTTTMDIEVRLIDGAYYKAQVRAVNDDTLLVSFENGYVITIITILHASYIITIVPFQLASRSVCTIWSVSSTTATNIHHTHATPGRYCWGKISQNTKITFNPSLLAGVVHNRTCRKCIRLAHGNN
jgi:hypothetical protein